MISTLIIALAQSIVLAGFQRPVSQTPGSNTVSQIRRIQVNAESLAQLSGGKKYVVDLTQRGVIYDFDSKTRSLDFTRVVIRTAKGEIPMSSWLEKNFAKTELAGWNSRHLRIGTTEGFRSFRGLPARIQKPPPGTAAFQCNPLLCTCKGDSDCNDMFSTTACGPHAACDLSSGVCACLRTASR
jgi:hypothetical protein